MFLFGKDNFTEINSIPDDSEISTNSEVKLDLTPIRTPPPRRSDDPSDKQKSYYTKSHYRVRMG